MTQCVIEKNSSTALIDFLLIKCCLHLNDSNILSPRQPEFTLKSTHLSESDHLSSFNSSLWQVSSDCLIWKVDIHGAAAPQTNQESSRTPEGLPAGGCPVCSGSCSCDQVGSYLQLYLFPRSEGTSPEERSCPSPNPSSILSAFSGRRTAGGATLYPWLQRSGLPGHLSLCGRAHDQESSLQPSAGPGDQAAAVGGTQVSCDGGDGAGWWTNPHYRTQMWIQTKQHGSSSPCGHQWRATAWEAQQKEGQTLSLHSVPNHTAGLRMYIVYIVVEQVHSKFPFACFVSSTGCFYWFLVLLTWSSWFARWSSGCFRWFSARLSRFSERLFSCCWSLAGLFWEFRCV